MANTIGNESMEKSWMRDGATSINIVVDLYFAWKLHSEGAFDYIWFTFVVLYNVYVKMVIIGRLCSVDFDHRILSLMCVDW